MKKRALKGFFSVLAGSIIVICFFAYANNQRKNKEKEADLLNLASSIVKDNTDLNSKENKPEQEIFSVDKISNNNNVVGILIIKKINVEAPIEEGVTKNVLKEAIGHFPNTNYWVGNVCLASHNRGSFAHYFEKINELNIGDEVIYKTELGTKIYTVKSSFEVSENDLSVLDNTKDNCLTLITCIKNKPSKRLCVRCVEKN